jgi:hypothetical protein
MKRLGLVCALSLCVASRLAVVSASPSAAAPRVGQRTADLVKVRGTTVTTDGHPLKHVRGECADASDKHVASWDSEEDGRFLLQLKPGTYKLWATAAKSKPVTLHVPRGARSVSVTVIGRLEKLVRVEGTVVSPEGKPMEPVQGMCTDTSGSSALAWVSDKEGKFVIRLRPGRYTLWAHLAKSRAVTLEVPADARSVSVTVIGRPGLNGIPLRFLLPDGSPARNALLKYGLHGGCGGIATDNEGTGQLGY